MAPGNLDMFSLLPESLLLMIISFLPFKDAARTCILSKRWLKLWHSTRNIEFNESFFVKPSSSNDDDQTKQAQRSAFLNFIEQFITNHKDRVVEKFSLKVSDPNTCRDTVERCISFSIRPGLKELGFDFSNPNWVETKNEQHGALLNFPTQLSIASSLEYLKLYSCAFSMPNLLQFRSLKEVSLGWMELRTNNIKTLLLTCRTIENLSLKKCWNLEHFDLGDNVPLGLTSLVLDNCQFRYGYFLFRAPNLKYFKYSGEVIGAASEIELGRRFVMEEAELDFESETEFYDCGTELYKFVEDFWPAKVLTVCSYLLQTIPLAEEPVCIQCGLNVRHLILKTQLHPYELLGFMFLLNSCPLLEKLTIDITSRKIFSDYVPPYQVDFTKFWTEARVTPKCVKKTLKVVEMKGCRRTMDQVMACRYLIGVGRVLEELHIILLREDSVEMCHMLGNFLDNSPRASNNLRLRISRYM